MATLWIRHADVVTLDAAGTIHRDADLLIVDGRIAAIGRLPGDTQADDIIDAAGHAALPGFFNAHCHAPMTIERGWAEDLPFPALAQRENLGRRIGARSRGRRLGGGARCRRDDPQRQRRFRRSLLLDGPGRGGRHRERDEGPARVVSLWHRR